MTVSLEIYNIERFAVHDGPGIRTLVFLKGCPLRCLWCCNPESQESGSQLLFYQARCIGCGKCATHCPQGAINLQDGYPYYDRDICSGCGECINHCPGSARTVAGYRISAEKLLKKVLRDSIFYRSVGGVTLSGGEPLFQAQEAAAFLRMAKQQGLNTAIETSGYASWSKVELVAQNCDHILYDLKHMSSGEHFRLTGVPNEQILQNLKKLSRSDCDLVVRMPLIPGCNDDDDNLIKTANFLTEQSVRQIHLLPYHCLGMSKYQALDREYPLDPTLDLDQRQIIAARDLLAKRGLEVVIGGLA